MSDVVMDFCGNFTDRNNSSEISNVPMAPRSAANRTWSGPYHALISSEPSILKNLRAKYQSISVSGDPNSWAELHPLVEHDPFTGKLRFFQLCYNLQIDELADLGMNSEEKPASGLLRTSVRE